MHSVRVVCVLILCAGFACLLLQSCDLTRMAANSGLKGGINYMQPMKWRLTYKYRVREIRPYEPFFSERPSEFDPKTPAVGPGTYEVWFVGPREGDEVRDVNLVYAIPEPTQVSPGEGGITVTYYDFTPDGNLPREISAAMQWEFITFERYTFWDGMPRAEQDRTSELYRKYTSEEYPITIPKTMAQVAESCVPKEHPSDYVTTALNCYNHIICNFSYDFSQDFYVMYLGGAGMFDSSRCWENKFGQCDEFANVMCSMLRSVGIPARPVAGLVHSVQMYDALTPVLGAGPHAWAEFYLPEVGWVPLDPTWSMGSMSEPVVSPYYSLVGAARQIPSADYFFGKHDPYRITLFKGWNIELVPPPKTPEAETVEMWFVGATERSSGVGDVDYGWEGIRAVTSKGGGWARSAKSVGRNLDIEIEALGPVSPSEIEEIIERIEAEGHHFLRTAAMPGNWPLQTDDPASQLPPPDNDEAEG